jgi:ribonuclease VapC
MFVDASAIVAVLANEPERPVLRERLLRAKRVLVSPIVLYEVTTAIMRLGRLTLKEAVKLPEAFVHETGAETVQIDADIGVLALETFNRYGRGRHKAKLNFGDCFAYACAKAHKVPLLYKGNDFALTDIEAA